MTITYGFSSRSLYSSVPFLISSALVRSLIILYLSAIKLDVAKGKMKYFFLLVILSNFTIKRVASLTSPCPTVFQYKTTTLSAAEYQSWSGVLYLTQNYDRRVSIDVLVDRAITHLSAHHFDVMTSDWKKFHLSSRNQTNLQQDLTRIFLTVEFNGQNVPKVEEIRLNGARICVTSPPVTSTTRNYDPYSRTEPRSTVASIDPFQDNNNYRTTERINWLSGQNENNRNANNHNNNANDRRGVNVAGSTRTSHTTSSATQTSPAVHNRQPTTLSSASNS